MAGTVGGARVPEHLRAPLGQMIDDLRSALGGDLVSVVLYGSAARGEHRPRTSDTNVLIVMRRVGAEQLRTLAGLLRRERKKVRLSPVVLSPDDLATCADTFAVELAEIQDRRLVLYGKDPVADIEIRPEHLRLQIEHELRGKLSRLRQSYLRDAGDPRAVARLMTNSLGSFLTLFAALLRLRGKTPAPERAALVEQVADLGVDSDVWQHLLAARMGDTRIATAEAHAIFERYLETIESVVNAADLSQDG